MANRRISMGKIRELLRLDEKCGLSNRQIARALNISRPAVKEYLINLKLSDITILSTLFLSGQMLRLVPSRIVCS